MVTSVVIFLSDDVLDHPVLYVLTDGTDDLHRHVARALDVLDAVVRVREGAVARAVKVGGGVGRARVAGLAVTVPRAARHHLGRVAAGQLVVEEAVAALELVGAPVVALPVQLAVRAVLVGDGLRTEDIRIKN